jgi:hypothetical protein
MHYEKKNKQQNIKYNNLGDQMKDMSFKLKNM